MASPLDYLMGLGETGATLGTGAISGLLGMPYGLYKGVTSGKYGTPQGVKIAEQEAANFMARNTYQPRTAQGQQNLQQLAGLLESTKLPPVIPEAALLGQIPRQAYAAQAERAGMAAERALAPVVERTMQRGGLPAQLMQDLTQGSMSQIKQNPITINSAESNARKSIEELMNQARYFGVDSPIDYANMPVGAVMQDLDSYLGMSKQVADLPDAAKTSLRNLWYKAEDAANAYKRVYGENKLMGKPEPAANDARKPFVWDEKKLKKNLSDGILTQEEYNNAIEWNKKAKGLLD